MSDLIGKKFDVLDHGYVILRDVMGEDKDVAEIARISYGQVKNPSENAGLLDHLMRHRHTSPFEMPVLRFHVKLPIFVERQWVRHRTCSMNEMSGRYSVMPTEFYVPEVDSIRKQSKTNKQGRDENNLDDHIYGQFAQGFRQNVERTGYDAFSRYEGAIGTDTARELARIILPLGTYTEKVWQMNLHNLLHFLKLRTDSHAQWEIQQYANVIEGIVAELFPLIYGSWKNHVKDAVTFSADEWAILKAEISNTGPHTQYEDEVMEDVMGRAVEESSLSKTRKAELKKKLGL